MKNQPSKEELENMNQEELKKHRTKCEVYSRVVGYLRPTEQWNPGKKTEFENRSNFDKAAE